MIPKILHQTAKTAVVPEKWRPLQDKVRDLHPGWEYHLWTDDDNLALLEARRPDLVPAYLSMPRPIMRADMIRYFYMEQFGGLYLDTDYEFLKPFDLGDRALVLPRESQDDQALYLGNCVFASVPGHAYWTAVLADLRDDPPGNHTDLDEDAVLRLTGPGFLTRIYQEHFAADSSIYVTPKVMFHPPIPQKDRGYQALVRSGQTYGIHYCFGSWRVLSVPDRLVRKLKKWGFPL